MQISTFIIVGICIFFYIQEIFEYNIEKSPINEAHLNFQNGHNQVVLIILIGIKTKLDIEIMKIFFKK